MKLWRSKVITDIYGWRAAMDMRSPRRHLVLTNGCFDLLHYGHVEFLEDAASQGDLLVVAVNSDESVRQLKGPHRPIVPENDRLTLIAGLGSVDYCFIFNDKRVSKILKIVQPNIWVKGGDYTLETLDPTERAAAEGVNAKIQIIPYVAGHSTTDLITRCKAAAAD